MSRYTTELRNILAMLAGWEEPEEEGGFDQLSPELGDVEEIISKARPKIFDFDYTLFDPAYKSVLETKILRHFYMREIGFETAGLWRLKLRTKLIEILPYYNQLYQSELLEFNPLYDVDLQTEHTKEGEGESSSQSTDYSSRQDTRQTSGTSQMTSHDEGTHVNKYSDTPQGTISGLEDGIYLTNASIDNDTSDGTQSGTTSGTENFGSGTSGGGTTSGNYTDTESYTEHVLGKTGGASYSSRLTEFRDTFLNIDMMIIDELETLFMHLW